MKTLFLALVISGAVIGGTFPTKGATVVIKEYNWTIHTGIITIMDIGMITEGIGHTGRYGRFARALKNSQLTCGDITIICQTAL